MIAANNLKVAYAEALLAATPADLLADGKKPRKLSGMSKEQMEREMGNLLGQYKLVRQSYGQDVLTLVLRGRSAVNPSVATSSLVCRQSSCSALASVWADW